MKYLYFLFLLLMLGCGASDSDTYEDEPVSSSEYSDGTYCADVTYHNPNTGTTSTYTLNVEVESNELIKIYWGNGGWLDDTHFSPEELGSNGYCSFTSDKGYEYTVQITGKECNYTDESKAGLESEEENEKITCPKCGDEKEEYDEYCYSCKRKIENKEEHTCPKCGRYDAFMFSTDDECSDCKRKREEEEEVEEKRKIEEEIEQ